MPKPYIEQIICTAKLNSWRASWKRQNVQHVSGKILPHGGFRSNEASVGPFLLWSPDHSLFLAVSGLLGV
jgi:hypothetical protein